MTRPPPRDHHIPDLVSLAEAAKMLRVSKQLVHRDLVTTGQLLGAQVGGAWVFRRTAVERLALRRADRQPGDT